MELDRIISNLPNDVTEKILSCLPLKEAVRTSILSRKWRYKWDTLQSLVFDGQCVVTQSHPTSKFVNIVDHVLLLHTGAIHKFKLSFLIDEIATSDMDRWIFHLSRNHVIKEMILDNFKGDFYDIPSCLFSFQNIIHLELYRCLLHPPSTFKGFGSLKSLDIWCVTLAQDVFDNLIGCSPLLEILKLRACNGFPNLKIEAPKLRFLLVVGVFEEFTLLDLNLADASFDLQVNVCPRENSSKFGNLLKFFDHQLLHIQRLTIKRRFLKYLSIGALPEKLPKPCQYLNFLSVDLNFDNPDEISTLLCLLRSSPALQELQILVHQKDHAVVGEVNSCLYDKYHCAYPRLRFLKITILSAEKTIISAEKALLDFIECLLLSSPVLERVTVKPASVDGLLKLVKDLLLFKRDSKLAEILVLDP